MSVSRVAKQFRCDLCGATAVVNVPDYGKIPADWAQMPVEIFAQGVRISDFCGLCLAAPFAQAVAVILTMTQKKEETENADGT